MRKTAVVDQKICVACGACVKACPMGTMTQMICKLREKEAL